MESVFAAIANLLRPHSSLEVSQEQGLPSPAIRTPGLNSCHLTREDRLQIYLDVSMEVARDRQMVFFCFVCEHFVIGRTCYTHHTKFCIKDHPHSRDSLSLQAPPFWRWLNCGFCFSQEVLAKRYEHVPHVCHVLRWSRFVRGLIRRLVVLAPWNCAARRPSLCLPLPEYVLEYF